MWNGGKEPDSIKKVLVEELILHFDFACIHVIQHNQQTYMTKEQKYFGHCSCYYLIKPTKMSTSEYRLIRTVLHSGDEVKMRHKNCKL